MSFAVKGSGIAHVGLPKTGSTYLQRHYFSALVRNFWSTQVPFVWPRELDFLLHGNLLWYQDIMKGAVRCSRVERSHRYASSIAPVVTDWGLAVRSFSALRDQDSWVLSAEGLCGFSSDVNALHMSLLKQAGVTRVLFVCRQQASWTMSLWRQFLLAEDRFARFVSFETLFGTPESDGVVDTDWNVYIQAMDAQFGSDNVLVLPYELLVNDSREFFMQLNVFLGLAEDALIPDPGARENPSRTDSMYQGLSLDGIFPCDRLPGLRSKLHRLAAKFPRLVPGFVKRVHSMSIPDQTLDALQRRMSAANKRLEARIGIDLEKYGYY